MKLLLGVLVALTLMLVGCGMSEATKEENRRQFELTHNMNIVRIRHVDIDTGAFTVSFSHHSPAYYWVPKTDSTYAFMWKIVDIRDKVIFFPTSIIAFDIFNRYDDSDEFEATMKEALEYYEKKE